MSPSNSGEATAPPAAKVVEQHRISPRPTTVPDTTLPITVFDVLWHFTGPIQRLFFYPCPNIATADFLATHFPALGRSLSLTLHSFFSLAGTAVASFAGSDIHDVNISYSDGDSVPFILAEADPIHSTALASDEAIDAWALGPFLPQIPAADGPGKYRLFAAQVTIFPGAGFTLGVCIHHVATDGTGYTQFMKTWAAIHRAGGDISAAPDPPVYDRGSLLHLDKKSFFEKMKQLDPVMTASLAEMRRRTSQLGRVVAWTFILTESDIEKLRDRIMSVTSTRPSTFVTVTAYVWMTMTRARGHDNQTVYFTFNADYRSRVNPKLPKSYFGNCIAPFMCVANGSDLCGPDGLYVAVRAVHDRVRNLGGDVVEKMKDTIEKMSRLFSERVLTVSGSSTFRFYEVDFGFGRPMKVQSTCVRTGAMTMSDSRDGSDGVEIGLAGPDVEMDLFVRLFQEGLAAY